MPQPGRRPKNDETDPALFQHCQAVYNEMLKDAKIISDFRPGDAGDETDLDQIVIWEGFLTQLVTGKLNLSVPYYTSITQALKRMECIRQLKRGGGTAPSQWELLREPTIELFHEAQPRKVRKQGAVEMLQQQITDLNARVSKLERALRVVIQEQEEIHG